MKMTMALAPAPPMSAHL
jgi:hypothetical protein